MKTRQEDYEEFKRKINELCNKYQFTIEGCGCCGSPWVDDKITRKTIADNQNFTGGNKNEN